MLRELTISRFLDQAASNNPVPGGGSVSALAGALAAALAEMVASLTIGRKDFEEHQALMGQVMRQAVALRERLADAIDRDAEAYAQVLAAFKLPKDSEEQQRMRRAAIQEAFKVAADVPLQVAEEALKVMALAETVVRKGNPNALTDGAVAAMMARSATLGALYNVKINLKALSDPGFVLQISDRVRALEAQALQQEKAILAAVDL